MKFTIFSHVDHCTYDHKLYAYAPYVREMNLWIDNFDEVEVVAHMSDRLASNIDMAYSHNNITFKSIKSFNLISLKNIFLALVYVPKITVVIAKAMYSSDHIHLRCPGNVGLLACIIQIFFPKKRKTAKYAGNWDPNSKQPWSYTLQKWILNNTFLTKNIQVLVYGEWEDMSKNIKPFFTATYSNEDAKKSLALPEKKINTNAISYFTFVGMLSDNKGPYYALETFINLLKINSNVQLDFYGEGPEKDKIQKIVIENNLQHKIFIHGNQNKDIIETALQNSHFLFLASKSEGWPKVVAEAMFWGCVPLTTNVSCVNQMIGFGQRGVILNMKIEEDLKNILKIVNNPTIYTAMSKSGKNWSTQYTLEKFETEIKKLI